MWGFGMRSLLQQAFTTSDFDGSLPTRPGLQRLLAAHHAHVATAPPRLEEPRPPGGALLLHLHGRALLRDLHPLRPPLHLHPLRQADANEAGGLPALQAIPDGRASSILLKLRADSSKCAGTGAEGDFSALFASVCREAPWGHARAIGLKAA
jgi:hypothetical protein